MVKLSIDQLQRAFHAAQEIKSLEAARAVAEDTTMTYRMGAPTPQNPMGINGVDVKIEVPIHANTIRMVLVDKLAPLYTELRNMGIELQL